MINKNELRKVVRLTGSKKRTLYTYGSNLKLRKLHEDYLEFIDKNFYSSKFSHAYVKKRSIYTNAILHLENDYFVKLDVKNFFPSLSHSKLKEYLYIELNRIRKDTISIQECAEIIENCSVNAVGLPLGLIPSPMLSNIYMKKFDGILYGLLRKLQVLDIRYTRYADDIFISFKSLQPESIPDTFESIIKICDDELGKQGLNLNEKKTRTVDINKSNHFKIAGINIVRLEDNTRRITVSRETVKDLYFNTFRLLKDDQVTIDHSEYNNKVLKLKGMHSFLLSVEKTGYSHVLSANMKRGVTSLGYTNLEELISKLETKPTNQ